MSDTDASKTTPASVEGAPPAPPGGQIPASPAAAMGATVGRGATWVIGATVGNKIATAIAQVVLGWILSDNDFGVYATAMALASLLISCRSAGLGELIIAKGPAQYPTIAGSIFSLATRVNLALAVLIALLAYPTSLLYGDSRILWILLIVALSTPTYTLANLLAGRLLMDLRYEAFARVNLISSLLRQGSLILFAIAGFGPLSFVLPLLVCGIYESVAGYLLTRDKLWKRPVTPGLWRSLLHTSKWVIFGGASGMLLDQGWFLTMALFVSKSVVGQVYFAFYLLLQLATLLSSAVQLVLMPALARLRDEPERLRDAAARAVRATMLAASGACVVAAVCVGPAEYLIWHGRWEPAVLAVQIFAIIFALRCTQGLTNAALQAQARFKRWSLITLCEGVGLASVAAAGAYFGGFEGGPASLGGLPRFEGRGSPADIALWCAVYIGISRFLVTAWILKWAGVPLRERLSSLASAWIIAAVAWVLTVFLDLFITWRSGGAAFILGLAQDANLSPHLSWLALEAVRLVALGTTCGMLFLILARTILPGHLRDAISIAPARLRTPAKAILRLRDTTT